MTQLSEVNDWIAANLPALIEKYDVPGAAMGPLPSRSTCTRTRSATGCAGWPRLAWSTGRSRGQVRRHASAAAARASGHGLTQLLHNCRFAR